MELGSTMRVLQPADNVLAFYDGRIAGVRAHSEGPNWLDDGAYSLGTAVYAVVDGAEALLFDTHMSLAHAARVRAHLTGLGVQHITVVLSHWHHDHVAGNAVFADCRMIAQQKTAALLAANAEQYGRDTPPIAPLIMPTEVFEGEFSLKVGRFALDFRPYEIHSADGMVMIWAYRGLLFAADTLEDTVTYVSEPERIATHLSELKRLQMLPYTKILPNHGAPEVIAAGGYGLELISATIGYTARLIACRDHPALVDRDLQRFLAPEIASGGARYFAPYQAVHLSNLKALGLIR